METITNALFSSFCTVKAILLRLQRLCFGILINTNLCFGITEQRLSRDCENGKTTIRINTNCLLQQHNLGDKQTRFCFDFCFLPAKRVVVDRSVSVARPPKGLQARKTEKRCFSIELWSSDPPLRRNYDPQTSLVKGNHWTKPERSQTLGMVWLHAAPPRGGWE